MHLPSPLILTNDDGIDAQGIRALHAVTGGVIIAPREQHSACSHKVTLDAEIRVARRGDGEFCVDGTPADCARLAPELLDDTPALLLSGINEGANLGHDTYLSGTVAAAREATAMGIPAISISQYRRGLAEVDWPRAQRLAEKAIAAVLERGHDGAGLWNINLPHPEDGTDAPEIVFCERCLLPLPSVYRVNDGVYRHDGRRYHQRTRTPGSDVDVCFGGAIAVTWIAL